MKIQERYGLTKEDAQKQIEDWERTRRQEDEAEERRRIA